MTYGIILISKLHINTIFNILLHNEEIKSNASYNCTVPSAKEIFVLILPHIRV